MSRPNKNLHVCNGHSSPRVSIAPFWHSEELEKWVFCLAVLGSTGQGCGCTTLSCVFVCSSLAETQLRLHLMQHSAHHIGFHSPFFFFFSFPFRNHCAPEGYNITDIMASTQIDSQMGQWINGDHPVQKCGQRESKSAAISCLTLEICCFLIMNEKLWNLFMHYWLRHHLC